MFSELCDVTQTIHEPRLLEGVSGSGLSTFVCTFKKKKKNSLHSCNDCTMRKSFFSKAREMTTEKRNRLHPSTADKILFMNKNLEI